jgi:hypothetical protein
VAKTFALSSTKNAFESWAPIGFTEKPSRRSSNPYRRTGCNQLPLPPDLALESDFLLVEPGLLDALEADALVESELVLLLSEEAAFL